MTCQALRGELSQCGLNPKKNKSIYYFHKTASCHSYPLVVRSALASKTSNMTGRTRLASPGARPEQMSPRPGQVTRAQRTSSALSCGTRCSCPIAESTICCTSRKAKAMQLLPPLRQPKAQALATRPFSHLHQLCPRLCKNVSCEGRP